MKVILDEGAYMPERAHEADAGYDLKTPEDIYIPERSRAVIDTGVHVQIPVGFAGLIVSKSGLNTKFGVTSTGLIDSGYTGSIKVSLYNHSEAPFSRKAGDKISQLIIIPVATPKLEQVDSFPETERGDGGFGSTGR